jgi:uncharacterized caspase-like protein
MLCCRSLITVLLLHAIAAIPAAAEKRVALVIGNSNYVRAGKLANPVHDAAKVAKTLRHFGFEVILGLDVDRRAFEGKVRAFSGALERADTAVLYYAGHGLQVAGHNYLIPADAGLKNERDLDFEAIGLDFVLKQMETGREGKTNIVFLDACRDNPLARNLARSMGTRSASVGTGLAEVQTGVGTFISFSTQPGNVAADGKGENSPFTASLAKHMLEPGRNLTSIMIEVRKDVLAATAGRQVPWDHSALTSDFYFGRGGRSQAVAAQKGDSTTLAAAQGDGAQALERDEAVPRTSANQVIAELDALAAAQSWGEMYDRLTNVSPTARDEHWNSLVEQAAIGELAPLLGPGGSAAERLSAIERYYPKFRSLGSSEKFLALRTKAGVEGFRRCFNEGRSNCYDDLERFVRVPPTSAALAIDAAHLAGRNMNRRASLIFYLLGLDAPGGEAVCKDSELLGYDLVFALEFPPEDRWAQAARKVTERCWGDAVKTAVAANIARVVGEGYYLKNTCEILLRHNALTGLLEKRCQAAVQSKESSQ